MLEIFSGKMVRDNITCRSAASLEASDLFHHLIDAQGICPNYMRGNIMSLRATIQRSQAKYKE